MDVNLFDFELPQSLIAQTPAEERTASRLMAVNKTTGEFTHHRFSELLDYLKAGDTLVLNDTRVLPARLFGVKKDTGARVELLLLKQLDGDRWETLAKPAKRMKEGTELVFGGEGNDALSAVVREELEMGGRLVEFRYSGIFNEMLDRLGEMPLPPYIHQRLEDKERYQTVYARNEGSAAAPTAGLHFTDVFLRQIEQKGVNLAFLTLHVGLGTFRPVSVDRIEAHKMHAEYYELNSKHAQTINETKRNGGRIIAVGTTSTRTLETLANRFASGNIEACNGWTDIFIYPGYRFRLVDAMLTNFHLPKSTLVMLVSAFAGRETVLRAYREAVERQYRFFSFGDAVFLY